MLALRRCDGPTGIAVGGWGRRSVKSSKLLVAAVLAAFAITACSGSATAPTGGSGIQIVTPAPGAASPAPVTSPDGTTTSPAPGGDAGDSCALLSTADLATTLGGAYAAGTLDSVGQCVWSGADGIVVLFVQDVELEFIKSTFTGGVDTTVGGNAAYWNPAEGLRSLWVDVGDGQTLVLSFPQTADLGPEDQAKAEKLAEIAIGKL
jgi:hypothetical protein